MDKANQILNSVKDGGARDGDREGGLREAEDYHCELSSLHRVNNEEKMRREGDEHKSLTHKKLY